MAAAAKLQRDSKSAERAWHALAVDVVLLEQETTPEGLTSAEAARRLERDGRNALRPPRRRGPIARFLLQFHNVLIYVLLIAGVVTALLEHWLDSAVIFGVVLVNATIGFIQEGKAERAIAAIRKMLSLHAWVLRDGQRVAIPAEEVTAGDIVFIQSGDKIPADLRLISVKNLQVQEAILTGESMPVEKSTEPVEPGALLGDRRSMAYAGALVTYGQATGVVVAISEATEIGKISTLVAEVEELTTPLLRQLAAFARRLTAAIIALAALAFVFGVIVHAFSATEMFLAAVGLAVAAIPEGLPAILTITLALGVQRMAARNAIIRRLPAVETLGSVSVICSDKTGTLTRNEMTVQTLATAGRIFEVTGVGYEPRGSFRLDGEIESAPAGYPEIEEMTRGALLCSDARVREEDGKWIAHGDPTEAALVVAAIKAGLDPEFETKAYPRTDLIPFESEHRFMATLHHDHQGHGFIFVKGAPERILRMCDRQRSGEGDEPLDRSLWDGRMDEIAARGQRVLALAARPVAGDHRELRSEEVEQGCVLLGVFGLADPPRHEAIDAVAQCHTAGIRVKMITGDHAATACSIGQALGLRNTDEPLTGADLDRLDDAQLRARVVDTDVFARTSPAHKLRLVEALQANSRVVAMTGDGVNDAPALKRADIGVAMGLNGTEAAKEAAEMVLADDNFASIAHAVEEGRTVYDNLLKSIAFILPTNAGEALTIMLAVMMGLVLPITAPQILWVNMITAVTLALSLAFEPAEGNVMLRPPRRPDEPLLSRFVLWRTGFVAAIIVAGVFGGYYHYETAGADIDFARTVAVNTLVMYEVFYLFSSRHLYDPVLNFEGIFGSRPVLISVALVIVFQMLFTYWAPFQFLFGTQALAVSDWLQLTAIASSVLFLVELEKALARRWKRAEAAPEEPH
jgi:magnesium-transporting ATPase (P-type)